jgi:hypothetical protein
MDSVTHKTEPPIATVIPLPVPAPKPAEPAKPATQRARTSAERTEEARASFRTLEDTMNVFSLTLFLGSAVVLRESVLKDSDSLIFPIGCGLFVLSVLLPMAARRRG